MMFFAKCYGDGVRTENSSDFSLIQMHCLVAISKGMQSVELCSNKVVNLEMRDRAQR